MLIFCFVYIMIVGFVVVINKIVDVIKVVMIKEFVIYIICGVYNEEVFVFFIIGKYFFEGDIFFFVYFMEVFIWDSNIRINKSFIVFDVCMLIICCGGMDNNIDSMFRICNEGEYLFNICCIVLSIVWLIEWFGVL